MFRWFLLICVVLVCGCQIGTLDDPNSPREGPVSPDILQNNLKAVSDALIERRLKGEIDNGEYRDLLAKAASELVDELHLKSVDPAEAWQYGEVLRAARNWIAAKEMLEIAVRHAKAVKNEDRRVNDSLRLAEVMARQGQVQAALVVAGEVLDAKPTDSAPILMAVLYEIAPAAKGREHDAELATLLESAILKHLSTQVDNDTQAGRDFMAARSHHVAAAYYLLGELYGNFGRTEKRELAFEYGRWARRNIDALSESVLQAGNAMAPMAGQSRL